MDGMSRCGLADSCECSLNLARKGGVGGSKGTNPKQKHRTSLGSCPPINSQQQESQRAVSSSITTHYYAAVNEWGQHPKHPSPAAARGPQLPDESDFSTRPGQSAERFPGLYATTLFPSLLFLVCSLFGPQGLRAFESTTFWEASLAWVSPKFRTSEHEGYW